MKIDPYVKQIKKIEREANLKLDVKLTTEGIRISDIPFKIIRTSDIYSIEGMGTGILVNELSPEETRFCDTHRISYLTINGKLKLFKDSYVLSIAKQKKTFEQTKARRIRQEISITEASPIVFISPNGFKILDALFQTPTDELQYYKSALSFAKQFNLNQPKLSKIIRSYKAGSILDLKNSISNLSDDSWRTAFSIKKNRWGMTPFFSVSKPHYSLLKLNGDEFLYELKNWQESVQDILDGPLEVAKMTGFLRDQDLSIWGTENSFLQLKMKFKLIPGVNKEKMIWQLGIPRYSFAEESLISIQNKDQVSGLKRPNLFRAIWDLGFGTERLKELQIPILRSIIDAI